MPVNSKIFLPNRALGYVSNHIPLVTRYIHRRKDNIIATCVGRSFHSYSCARLALLAVSALHESEITCMAGDTYHVYTASGNSVYAWRRGTELKHTYSGHCSPVHLLLPFGAHLLSVDEDSLLKIWDIKTEETYGELTFNNNTFRITAICHPATYVNKILLGSEQGQMQLWNIKSSRLIYTFAGWSSQVTVLEQPPAVDVMGIGLANGRIILHNLKYDQTVMKFTQDWGLVTALSFRTDGNPVMASGSLNGHVVFWNLEEKRVASQQLSVHTGAVNGLKCLPNEPLLVTSSADNSLKLWIFDMPDGGVRLLRIREGHSAPPTYIRFHGDNGKSILTAGGDSSLREFNTVTEAANHSFGKAYYDKKLAKKRGERRSKHLKMPPVVQFTSETTCEEWDNIACIHLGIPVVTTWSFNKRKMGELKLIPNKLNGEPRKMAGKFTATSICLTHCGNFVVIGYSTGNVERFNIQSGIWRGSYGIPAAHKGPVRGVAIDPLNQIVTTGGSDALIRFWDFKNSEKPPLTILDIKEAVAFFQTHRESSLLCIALEDFSLSIVDMETRTVVRHFSGHTGQLTDATFSPDSRWLITAGMDCTLRTWDIPAAQLVDLFQVDSPCTSLTMSPTGEFLATTHINYLGIFLWSNRTLFSHVSLKPISEDSVIPVVQLPLSSLHPDEVKVDEEEETDDTSEQESPEQIEKLITLSTLATSRWQNLLDIDIVKKRNRPSEPAKSQKAAPFFLPTLPSLNLEFDFSDMLKNKDGSKDIRLDQIKHTYTPFGKLLLETAKTDDFAHVIEKLKSMGPSAIDFEINSMSLEGGGSIELLLQFLKMVNSMLKNSRDFELGQAYLALFLKVHGEVLALTPELFNYMTAEVQENQTNGWKSLEEKFLYTLCIVDALKKL